MQTKLTHANFFGLRKTELTNAKKIDLPKKFWAAQINFEPRKSTESRKNIFDPCNSRKNYTPLTPCKYVAMQLM